MSVCIVHFDGSCEPTNPGGRMGCAWVALDADGREVAHDAQFVDPAPANTNNQAEYLALIGALAWLRERHITGVIVRGDSQLVINQMLGKWRVNNPTLAQLRANAVDLAREVAPRFEWVPREQNTVADAYSTSAEPHTPPTDDLDLIDVRALVRAGLTAHARRAWLAAAKAAPLPPAPAPRGRAVSVEELDEAIEAALARGTSSLEEIRMAKVHVKMVPEPAGPRGRASCVVCGLNATPAVAGVPVCALCAEVAPQSRARLIARREGHERALEAAQREALAAATALDEQDAARWAKIAAARTDPEQTAWLAKVKAAILDETSPKVSDALRRAWHADEIAFWAVAGAREEIRRVEVARAHLEAAVGETGPVVAVASLERPGVLYHVARDGATCTCPGFAAHKHCKHARRAA